MPRFHLQSVVVDSPLSADAPDWLEPVGLGDVLDDTDRVGSPCKVPAPAAVEGFEWQARDRDDTGWYPQGITTSADATGGDLDGRDVIITSWYEQPRSGQSRGSRVSCIDYSDPARPVYRHVLLVEPGWDDAGRLELRPVLLHAGGIVWYGPYLYVAGTAAGIRVFRMEDIMRVHDPDRSFDYTHVLPQFSAYAGQSDQGWEDMRYSFMSLDRSGDTHHLITGEYGRRGETHRLTRYALDRSSQLLSADSNGRSLPLELHEQQVERMQGAVLVDGTWVLTSSQGEGVPGDLWVGQPGKFKRHARVLPTGPEDITYWPARRQLWSVTEWPGRRWVYAMDADRWVPHS